MLKFVLACISFDCTLPTFGRFYLDVGPCLRTHRVYDAIYLYLFGSVVSDAMRCVWHRHKKVIPRGRCGTLQYACAQHSSIINCSTHFEGYPQISLLEIQWHDGKSEVEGLRLLNSSGDCILYDVSIYHCGTQSCTSPLAVPAVPRDKEKKHGVFLSAEGKSFPAKRTFIE